VTTDFVTGSIFKLAFSLRGVQYATVFTLLVVLTRAAAFENAEPGKDDFDGVYWAVSTMTTVGMATSYRRLSSPSRSRWR
jgi:hypothetical protein